MGNVPKKNSYLKTKRNKKNETQYIKNETQ